MHAILRRIAAHSPWDGLNGIRTVNGAQDSKFASGPIALQYGAGVVKFRKVEIKPL